MAAATGKHAHTGGSAHQRQQRLVTGLAHNCILLFHDFIF